MNTAFRLAVAVVTSAFCLLQAQAALSCSISNQGDQVVISWPSESGKTYALSRTDKPDGYWHVVSLKTATAEPLSVTVPVEGTTAFFRLIEAPPNPDPSKLVWIPPGTFTMGSPEDEVDRNENEGPQTQVTLTKGFWMGKCEVTQAEYQAVMDTNPSYFTGDPSLPVEQVSWNSATDYCSQLTQRERTAGRIPSNYAYRLPTEAEWEHACRAGTTTRYSYGDDPGYSNLGNYAWYHNNSGDQTHTVGRKVANPWGLYDMHGNVCEWCEDWWFEKFPGGVVIDPQGPAAGSYRVLRGGYWDSWVANAGGGCRSAIRDYSSQGGFNVGLRVVLAMVATGEPPNPDPEHLVWIPPGTFKMGSPEDEVDRSPWEGPQTIVTLTKGFWIGKYEVTQAEYQEVVGNNPSYFTGDANRPVDSVNWHDAVAYCTALTERERTAGRIATNTVYRLPTEAEWEYACRAGTTTRFSHGDDVGYSRLTLYAWYHDNSEATSHPVGQKLPNPWGLHDVYGNVQEWCQDGWSDSLLGGTVTDPPGTPSGSTAVYRGGYAHEWPRDCRSASRIGDSVDYQGRGGGFRVVLAVVDAGEPVNPDPSKLVWIPPGTFTMGSQVGEVDRGEDEGPQTQVTLTKGFWMGKYEVTQAEYVEVIGNNPSYFTGDTSQPVEQVTWWDATHYCGQLTERKRTAGRVPSGYAYRLPTEGEWEYACRAGTTTRFSFGDDPAYAELTSYAWYFGNSGGMTHPVGQQLANPWGLHDVHGNVYEWCASWWTTSLPGGTAVDPQGPPAGDYRVIRGGSWDDWGMRAKDCRSANRNAVPPGSATRQIGFRVVLAAGQP
jgi:formylglycine-generating enzyme required for sulfatase activity